MSGGGGAPTSLLCLLSHTGIWKLWTGRRWERNEIKSEEKRKKQRYCNPHKPLISNSLPSQSH